MITLSFLTIKGGTGKTTTSFNVSAGLADRGYRVLLIDLCKQGNLSKMFSTSPEVTISDVFRETIAIEDAPNRVDDNLSYISASMNLKKVENELQRDPSGARYDILSEAKKRIENKFDYCIIDNTPDINILTINALFASNHVIVPTKPNKFGYYGFEIVAENIQMIRSAGYKLDIGCYILFTMVDRNNAERKYINTIREIYKDNVFKAEIRYQSSPIINAENTNRFVIRDNPIFTPVAKDFTEVVKEIIRRFPVGGEKNKL